MRNGVLCNKRTYFIHLSRRTFSVTSREKITIEYIKNQQQTARKRRLQKEKKRKKKKKKEKQMFMSSKLFITQIDLTLNFFKWALVNCLDQ